MAGMYTGTLKALSVPSGLEKSSFDDPYGNQWAVSLNDIANFINNAGGQAVEFSNVLHGGDFTVNPWQRGTSATGISTGPTYLADRWAAVGGASSSISMSRQSDTDYTTFPCFYQLRFQRAAANADTAVITLAQAMETASCYRLRGQYMLLSFVAKAGANFSAAGSVLNANVYVGTGTNQSTASLVAASWTAQASAAVSSTSFVLTATPTRYYLLAFIPLTASQIGVAFSYTPVGTAGANDWVEFYNIDMQPVNIPPQTTDGTSYTSASVTQTQLAAIAPAPERRSLAVEFMLCARFCQRIAEPASGTVLGTGMVTSTNNEIVLVPVAVPFRAAPTVTVVAGSFTFNIAGTPTAVAGFAGASAQGTNAMVVTGTTTATSGQGTLLTGGGGAGYVQGSADL